MQFTTDVRSENKTHLTFVVDGLMTYLYIDGVLAETAELKVAVADVREGFYIGGDGRTSNQQNFKGTIYAVNLFSDVRTDAEIFADAAMVQCADDSLIYSNYLAR